jgi:hypothetical protein
MRLTISYYCLSVTSMCLALGGAWIAEAATADDATRAAPPSPVTTDPLSGTLPISPQVTGPYAKGEIASMLPPRSDSAYDWQAGLEPLHQGGEPRWLRPCIPPPPCHPSCPPQPLDLLGVDGIPTRGPRYRGPCCPRTGTHDDGPLPLLHRLHDRAFDHFYRSK